MARERAGIAVGRRAARLAIVGGKPGGWKVLWGREVERSPGVTPAEAVEELLASLPKDLKPPRVAVSLSSLDLACDDVWPAPEGLRPRDVRAVAPVLLEARAAGETLEQLSADFHLARGQLAVVALDSRLLAELRRTVAAKGVALGLVTSIPAAVASAGDANPSMSLVWAGQRIEVSGQPGRAVWSSVPSDAAPPTLAPLLSWNGLAPSPEEIPALSTALCDPERVPCALRGAPDAPRSFGERLRGPLAAVSLAAAVFLAALGMFFRAKEGQFREELAQIDRVEAGLWTKYQPGRTRTPGDFLRAVKDRLRDSGATPGEGNVPSAFLILMDLAKHLPEPEAVGLTLESLDLSPDGGRMAALVAAAQGDALRNAALLEGRISESSRIAARGDFEARPSDVQVRLKMEWRGR